MQRLRLTIFLILTLLLTSGIGVGLYVFASPSVTPFQSDAQVSRLEPNLQNIDVTLGRDGIYSVEDFLFIFSPAMRAYFEDSTGDVAGIEFTYFGPTTDESRLASGAVRQQIGLKLRAPDSCNTLYVMWRIKPDQGIVVSTKRNPGEHADAVCGARGYENIQASGYSAPVESIERGERHSLWAQFKNDQLVVYVDDRLVWLGDIPTDLVVPDGQAGIRTDNGVFMVTPYWEKG